MHTELTFSLHEPFIAVFHYRNAGSDRYGCVLILRMNIQAVFCV